MAKSRPGGLGRGLSSLIPEPTQPTEASPLRDIALDSIVPNTYQPRREFEEDALDTLSASIRELGVLQPILVRQLADDRYELIAGERRWRAARRAGLTELPAIVRDVDDETSLAQAVVENVQRAELNAIEEAAAFEQLIDEFSLTQDQVATRVGRSRPAIANSLRLLQLPMGIQRSIIEGRISAGHGRALVALEPAVQETLAERTIDQGLSVRALEALVRQAGEDTTPDHSGGSGTGSAKAPALLEVEELLGERFDTKVAAVMGAKRGKLTIDFADLEDLDRIYTIITGTD